MTRASAIDGVNSAVLAPCGPHVNDAVQNFTVDRSTGAVSLLGRPGFCFVRAGKSTANGATGDKTTIASCNFTRSADKSWVLRRNGNLVSGRDGHCVSRVPGTVYLEVVPCTPDSTLWTFHANQHGEFPSSSPMVASDGSCLTAVEQSWIDDAVMAIAVTDIDSSAGVPVAEFHVVDKTRVRAITRLQPGQTLTVTTASLTSFDVHGLAFSKDPLRAQRVASNDVDAAVIDATLALLNITVSRLKAGKPEVNPFLAHQRHWDMFWNASTIDITTKAAAETDQWATGLNDALTLLEANYFGSQYILQSAGRSIGQGYSGRTYQKLIGVSSLFGPFVTGDYIGWNGDITLNYNAGSNCF
eukprot:SAG31_NODE_1481_length_8176_cov_3.282531_2_plen_357_part_00